MRARASGRWTVLLLVGALGVLTTLLPGVSRADTAAGAAGTDTSLPLTASAVTVSGRGRFASLRITVNQTANLANQAVSITWKGGTPTTDFGGGTGTIGEHFLQVFQCWGDPDAAVAENPGPPPQQCVQGASNGAYGGTATGQRFQGNVLNRIISERGAPNFDPSLGTVDEYGSVSLPFRAVDGTVVPQWRDTKFNPQVSGGNYWLNPYFNIVTTNEIPGGVTAPDGTGAELFEVTTGLESSGLGCGQKVQKLADGSTKVPRCWLVIVPRGDHTEENRDANISPLFGVATSPVAPGPWSNRIAVPLDFNPVDTPCPLNADQRRIVGSELLSAAVSSWQPALCGVPGLSPYAYGAISDSRARAQIQSSLPGAPGMAVVGRPIDPATVTSTDPIVYAPLTLSATVIGFNVERLPRVIFPNGQEPPAEVLAAEKVLAGTRVAQINLTPRLVAKLLTQSYRSQVEIAASKPPYDWAARNPPHIGLDEDFLRFNPEFRLLRTDSKNMGGFVAPGPGSDAALQLWEWVLTDPEAKAWLHGRPDVWGMTVNPVYTTDAAKNPQGAAFAEPVPDSYPKSDPYCYQAPPVGSLNVVPPPLCGLDWLPYASSLRDAARAARAASDGARTEVNSSPASPDQVYRRDPPQALGARALLSVTDSPSAAQYGLQMARLSRAGDNGDDRRFVAPDPAGLTAGLAGLVETDVRGFRVPDAAKVPAGGYPLTAIAYAAVQPTRLDDVARKEYAAFVDYAAGPGQVRGFAYGLLPAGYLPLPEPLRKEATIAAALIRSLQPPADPAPEADAPMAPSPRPAAARPGARVPQASAGSTFEAAAVSPLPEALAPVAASLPEASSPQAITNAGVARPLPASRWALPLLVGLSMVSALGALQVTKLPRRRSRSDESTREDQ